VGVAMVGPSQLPFSMARAPALVVVLQMALSGLRVLQAISAQLSRTTPHVPSFRTRQSIEITFFQVSGAVVNVTLWPSKAGQTDFLHEGRRYIFSTAR
jgi:hypothetical protein